MFGNSEGWGEVAVRLCLKILLGEQECVVTHLSPLAECEWLGCMGLGYSYHGGEMVGVYGLGMKGLGGPVHCLGSIPWNVHRLKLH
jgi:hypothetical protein